MLGNVFDVSDDVAPREGGSETNISGSEGRRFLLDESTNYHLAPYLRRLKHDVTAVGQDYPASLKDVDILAIAVREHRVVITNDRDFGELVVREAQAHAGVILFRLGTVTTADLIARLADVLTSHSDDLDHLIIVSRSRVRVRRLRIVDRSGDQ
jgi:predicted nuclease of predicted toxin-antitoxin system